MDLRHAPSLMIVVEAEHLGHLVVIFDHIFDHIISYHFYRIMFLMKSTHPQHFLWTQASNLVAFHHHFSFLDIVSETSRKRENESGRTIWENPEIGQIFEELRPPVNIPLRKEGNFVMVGLGSRWSPEQNKNKRNIWRSDWTIRQALERIKGLSTQHV